MPGISARLSCLALLALAWGNPACAQPQPAEASERIIIARRGDTLAALLLGARIAIDSAAPALAAMAPLFPPSALKPGHEVTLRLEAETDRLLGLEVEAEPGRSITVTLTPRGWQAQEERAEQRRMLVLAEGTVQGALIENLRAAGLPPALSLSLIRALSYQVDFQRDLLPGDQFRVVFERYRDPDGELLRHGRVLHAAFVLSGRRIALWRRDTAEGADWFDDNGQSLRRAFLRTPLDGARISSGFGARLHPVLGYTRMHQGLDFAAPTGTPVYAAADGMVAAVRREHGYGLLVQLRHGNGTETRYAHLSAFSRGLRAGQRVRQGEAIGRVGSTGLATGPHLHYEVVQAGHAVNPASSRPQPQLRLAGRPLREFQAQQQALRQQVARLAPMQEVAAAPE